MALPILPLDVWTSQITQASIPANMNALRVEVMARPALAMLSAQPVAPDESDLYIIGASPTGAQWAGFTVGNLAIFKGGTWLEFTVEDGLQKYVADDLFSRISGVWVNQSDIQEKLLTQQINLGFDGGESVIKLNSFNSVYIGYACEIQEIVMIADQVGSATVTLELDSYTNHPPTFLDDITPGSGIAIASALKTKITDLTGFDISIPADSVLKFAITSVANIKKLSIAIKVKKV